MKKGDYVLATKYFDGSPDDQWCVGFYDREEDGRHFVVGEEDRQFRANGFRRVEKITDERGEFILTNKSNIQYGDRSLWWWNVTLIK